MLKGVVMEQVCVGTGLRDVKEDSGGKNGEGRGPRGFKGDSDGMSLPWGEEQGC